MPLTLAPRLRFPRRLSPHCALAGAASGRVVAELWSAHPALQSGFFVGARRCFGVRPRNKGNVYVPRKLARTTLVSAGKQQSDPRLLMPPYVSAAELRVIFRLDYAGIFKLLGVRREQAKYFWRDHEGREFETAAKRKVLVPFEIAAIPAEGLGFRPVLLDVEPDWDTSSARRGVSARTPPVPVVAVLGHINHGKTTLLDSLCGTAIAPTEPGGITQGVRALTGRIAVGSSDESGPLLTREEDSSANVARDAQRFRHSEAQAPPAPRAREDGSPSAAVDLDRVTFIDTPGHEAFELQRGRTMASADLALVVVSVERGAEVQTEEVLLHASRWGVPVVFALNKIDLPGAHVELTRAELRRQCQRLYEAGLVDVDWTREAENAVPISALHGTNLDALMRSVRNVVAELPRVPARPPQSPTATPGAAAALTNVSRRTDLLVGAEASPHSVALVIESERTSEQGEHVLTLLVRSGRLLVGQHFVVGTLFGRVTQLAVASGVDEPRWKPNEDGAGPGVAVKIMGLKTHFGGDCAPDDLLFALSTPRAWRLSEHRRRIETLASLQTKGPELRVSWEHDGGGVHSRTQAAFARHKEDHPERHAARAYERRLEQAAVEEFGAEPGAPRTFSGAARSTFDAPFPSGRGRDMFSIDGSSQIFGDAQEEGPELILEAWSTAAATTSGGRRSARAKRTAAAEGLPDQGQRKRAETGASGFSVLQPEPGDGEEPRADASSGSGRGRRSARRPSGGAAADSTATGAWSGPARGKGVPESDFVYYVDRSSWTEEADIDSARLRSRWQERDVARWEEQQRQEELMDREKQVAEQLRREMFGDSRRDLDVDEEGEEEDDPLSAEPTPLPQRVPVVSMILKTKSVGQFDVLMDEVERVQEEHGVKIAIVHGGLGPVIPKDVTHAEVEKQYGFCPIYAFQVGVHPVAAGQADKEAIHVRRFDVFTDLVADLDERCARLREKGERQRYAEVLKTQPTASGL